MLEVAVEQWSLTRSPTKQLEPKKLQRPAGVDGESEMWLTLAPNSDLLSGAIYLKEAAIGGNNQSLVSNGPFSVHRKRANIQTMQLFIARQPDRSPPVAAPATPLLNLVNGASAKQLNS